MRISIITPCRNAAKTIERTITSVIEQNYRDIEYIICDGASSDDTMRIVERFGDRISEIISEKDSGVADALNKGFRRATGDIFCYLNADDCLCEGALLRASQIFEQRHDADVVTGWCRRYYADGSTSVTKPPHELTTRLALRNDIEQPSTFWRAAIHKKCGELDEKYMLAFDWEWWNRIHVNGGKFFVDDFIYSIYYFSDDNLTSRAGMKVVDEMYRITKHYGPFEGLAADVYKYIFENFDLRGFYDLDIDILHPRKENV